jgi:5'-nucleotidase
MSGSSRRKPTSGLAHSLTLNDPLRLRQISEKTFAVRGTPTDCVIMAVRKVMDRAPDLILSGVNSGQNAADDVTYSGTVAGAIEGTLLGIPSIALSQAYEAVDGQRVIPWETVEAHAPRILKKLVEHGCPRGVLYNLNFPNTAPGLVTGIEVTSQGVVSHGLSVDERHDGRGNPYFWLKHQRIAEEHAAGTDVDALQRRVISVTPLRIDMTAYDQAHGLKALFD